MHGDRMLLECHECVEFRSAPWGTAAKRLRGTLPTRGLDQRMHNGPVPIPLGQRIESQYAIGKSACNRPMLGRQMVMTM